ncbi:MULTISPECIES: hypothetical protein [unclassified Streptomyces]|uniref:hypothetical protein n=1 Tax=unclassified Streptomyces TaxID=2593676 RepID=UPI00278BEC6D|nr:MULTISPECIES: hypothetical protein [unclassified Streptomyces]
MWSPPEGEQILARDRISFASGAARPVKGMRWFRDPYGRDIQAELPGWPAGPVFEHQDKPDRSARAVGGGFFKTAAAATMGVIAAAGGAVAGSLAGQSTITSQPQDPATEVDDFPVLCGPVGSIAATLPWQLDPGRWHHAQPAAKEPVVHCHSVITDRRFLITEIPDGDLNRERVLWEIDKSHISAAGQCPYSEYVQDFKVIFSDGSWARFATPKDDSASGHQSIALTGQLLPEGAVPSAVRKSLAEYLTAQNKYAPEPWTGEANFFALPGGVYAVVALGPGPVSAADGRECNTTIMDELGESVVHGEATFPLT